jgi:hypothetical protein
MPRPPRADHPEVICHLSNRANARASILVEEADFQRFEKPLAEEREAGGVQLYAWCLMPTHWHLVARSEAPGQSARDSGLMKGRRTSWSGRAPVRAALSMAATRRCARATSAWWLLAKPKSLPSPRRCASSW